MYKRDEGKSKRNITKREPKKTKETKTPNHLTSSFQMENPLVKILDQGNGNKENKKERIHKEK